MSNETVQRILTYIFVTGLISPCGVYLDVWFQSLDVTGAKGSVQSSVLDSGPLYLFAVTLGIATFFDVGEKPYFQSKKVAFNYLRAYMLIAPLMCVVLFYVPLRLGMMEASSRVYLSQVVVALSVFAAATFAKIFEYRTGSGMRVTAGVPTSGGN